jgi:transcriptional regulator with XRE-family HTH domain
MSTRCKRTIREFRRAQGLTQRQLAARLGVSHRSVGHWEAARNEPSARQLRALAGVFGVSMDVIGFEREAAQAGMEAAR